MIRTIFLRDYDIRDFPRVGMHHDHGLALGRTKIDPTGKQMRGKNILGWIGRCHSQRQDLEIEVDRRRNALRQ